MRAILRRILQLFVVLVVVTAFVSVLLEFLPGDPTTSIAPFATDEQRQIIREDAGLDDPLPVRYVQWLGDFVSGDMGNYYRGPTVTDPVSEDVWNGFGVSFQLMIYVQILTLVFAIPLGIFAAYRATSVFDKAANAGAFAFISMPNFVLGFILAFWVGVKLGWLPVSGYTPFGTTRSNTSGRWRSPRSRSPPVRSRSTPGSCAAT